MAHSLFPLLRIGPFDRISSWSLPAAELRLHLIRDDGLHYTPDGEENIEFRLHDDQWNLLFQGSTLASPELHHLSDYPGLIVGFRFADPHYVVTFNLNVVEESLNCPRNRFAVFLITQGDRTLETLYPRNYTAGLEPVAIRPGTHTVRIPFWEPWSQILSAQQRSTTVQSLIRSSVPFTVRYAIGNAIALGRFRFPVLAVTWSPNAHLTGWSHELHFTLICPNVEMFLPRQNIAELNPPSNPPLSPSDRVRTVYRDLILILGLGACNPLWNSMRVEVTSDFGYAATIPFTTSEASGYSDEINSAGSTPPT